MSIPPDYVSIDRLADYLPDGPRLREVVHALIDDTVDGGYPIFPDIERVGDLRRLGPQGLARRCPDLPASAVEWLFAGLRRPPGRPRKEDRG